MFCAPFWYGQLSLVKTGSGQTRGQLSEERRFTAGRRLFSGIAQTALGSPAPSEEVHVKWHGAEAETDGEGGAVNAAQPTLVAVQGQSVVLRMELRAGVTLFSFGFE